MQLGEQGRVACLKKDEQMGEGWSDFIALVLTARPIDTATTSRGIGNYVLYEDATGFGVRPTPYTTDTTVNGVTYGDIGGLAVPHGVGYAWASMLWEVYWNLIADHRFNPSIYGAWSTGGNNLALQLVVDGMKLQPCDPGFVDGRDAILLADQLLTDGETSARSGTGSPSEGAASTRSREARTRWATKSRASTSPRPAADSRRARPGLLPGRALSSSAWLRPSDGPSHRRLGCAPVLNVPKRPDGYRIELIERR
jgi:Fungalysin metallopeptidase (M36)